MLDSAMDQLTFWGNAESRRTLPTQRRRLKPGFASRIRAAALLPLPLAGEGALANLVDLSMRTLPRKRERE